MVSSILKLNQNALLQRKLMKMIALDIGDQWTGIAISDALGMLARPLKTVASRELDTALVDLFKEESIQTCVVGLPKTLRGTQSQQTKKVIQEFEILKDRFKEYEWVMWDERLTSKQASHIKPAKTKNEKLLQHAVAAALILGSYLDYVQMNKNND
jgi:putative Holliday junction resolvase